MESPTQFNSTIEQPLATPDRVGIEQGATIATAVAGNEGNKEMNLDQQHHVDFISTLPFDLVGCILPQLPKQQLMECMTVSKIWRAQVLECEEAWREVEVSSSSGTLDDPKFFKVTQIQAKHIRRLELLDPGDHWIKLLGDLRNLHTLCMSTIISVIIYEQPDLSFCLNFLTRKLIIQIYTLIVNSTQVYEIHILN